MPVIETQIQHREVVPFFCKPEREGGLGYRETPANIVSDTLFIPSHLQEFIQQSSPMAWKALVSKYHHDETALMQDICQEIRQKMLETSNVATFLNQNKKITFKGESLIIFYVSGTEINGDADFEKNIFAAVEEMSHNIVCDGITLQRLRPDVTFFVNGIYLGYMEIKIVSKGQTARTQGRGKIISDYLESVKGIADRQHWNTALTDEAALIEERRSTLFMFEKAIHLTACDIQETYVMRNIASFFDDARREFYDRTATVSKLAPDIESTFKIYPISSELLSERQRFEEVMRNLYSKRMIEKEILYYNFLQYKYKGKANKRVRVSNRGTLIAPRPKQKFGCDKIINRVKEMLAHESEPNFYSDILRRQLAALSVAPERIDEIVAQRDHYCNNKFVYSLLLQYAAGFGKSNIIGWTALQLKDLRHNGAWAYDKIMIVVDRLQLRDQLDQMMMSMNIDKSMFVEVTNQDLFIKALSGNKRIIVVNIQKFMELQNALNKAGKTLKKMRVAFLIDEIHRSNTGENNKEMINLFEKLQDSINSQAQEDAASATPKKKNLIVGFTATPTDKVLARFGEFKSASIIPTWVPFDAYTMQEAIDDKYILDPTKHIVSVSSRVHFELPEEYDPANEDQTISIEKQAIYDNPERREQIARFVVNRLVSQVYGKIHGSGKAMLAVSSIPNAIAYCNDIRRLMIEKCTEEEKLYGRYKDVPISIVYSDNQECESSSSMNNQLTEEKVIENFKLAKNGLMIVVDKLQTGFDDPHLHTLFLDKEIQDINAIQTISRVNRTCKYKTECQIVDFSWKGVNVDNIKEAFRKYCGITTSEFNPDQEAIVVKMLYDELCKSEPYQRWYTPYKRLHVDTTFTMQMEDGIRQWIKRQFELCKQNDTLAPTDDQYMQVVNLAKELRKTIGKYGSSLAMLEDVLDIDAKYREGLFLHFWEIYCRIYKSFVEGFDPTDTLHPEIEGDDEIPGITIVEESGEEEGGEGGSTTGGGGNNGGSHPKQDILAMIQAWNQAEALTAEEVQKWKTEIESMFTEFRDNSRFMAVIMDNRLNLDTKMHEYTKVLNHYRRSLSLRSDIEHVELLKNLLQDNAEQLLGIFMEDLNNRVQTIDFE